MMPKLYGDPHRVTAVYYKEIKQWPHIKPGDAEAYRKFITSYLNVRILHKCRH